MAEQMIGRLIGGRYEIVAPVARGGMAEVYRARDTLLGRTIALKVLHPEFAVDQSFVERFRREAQAAANLNHPHIVAVYDWGSDGSLYFMVLEFVEGQSLRDVLRTDGRLPARRVIEIGAETASALHFAHRHGLVHRDVKPGNILITPAGDTKVTDFGIAWRGTSEGLTQTGAVIGTATYFSPEQAQGMAVDPRTDVYSLGVVMYEALTGTPPFSGDSPVAVAYKHVREDPPPLQAMAPDAPPDLDAIVSRALAKSPDNRYQTAEELRQDLARFAQGQPVLARTVAVKTAVAVAPTAVGAAPTRVTTRPAVVVPPPLQQVDEPLYYDDAPRRWPVVLLVIVLVAGLLIGLLVLAGSLGAFRREQTPAASKVNVPDVRGARYEPDAKQILTNLGFNPLPVATDSVTVAAGDVIDTVPASGASVDKGSTVRVFVSKGRATLKVPSVTGLTRTEAERLLGSTGFVTGRVDEKTDPTIEKGKVISQDPAGNAEVPRDTPVNLVVSSGKDRVKVPQVVGLDATDAARRINESGLKVGDRREEESTSVAPGKVIRTEPPVDEEVDKNTRVNLFVSKAPEKIRVPNVQGNRESAARTTLEEAGLVVFATDSQVASEDQNGIVQSQNPASGTEVEKNSTVTIVVGRYTAPTTTTTTTTTTSPTTTTSSTTTSSTTTSSSSTSTTSTTAASSGSSSSLTRSSG